MALTPAAVASASTNPWHASAPAWGTMAAVCIPGTAACAVAQAMALETFIIRPTDGGSITTLLPAMTYASATIMKVSMAAGLMSAMVALAGWMSGRLPPACSGTSTSTLIISTRTRGRVQAEDGAID